MAGLNESQQNAVNYTDGPLLIVAGAGTGKTTVITEKVAYLISQKLAKPEEILALTFTEKAAQEMEERASALINISYSEMQISTFHSFCQRILETYGLDIGISNDFDVLTNADGWLLVRENLDKFNLDYYRPLGNPSRHIHELIRHFSKCKDELITPEEYLKYAEGVKLSEDTDPTLPSPIRGGKGRGFVERERLTEIADAYHTYNQLLIDNNCFDFGDLIFYSIKLLKERSNILALLQKRFKFILVDEFQDVNWAQYQLVRLLTGKDNQLTVVGDDDQSIYAFRGASVSNILRLKEDYPDAKEVVLTENYRSGQRILDMAHKVIQNNDPDRLEMKLGIDKTLKSAVRNLKSEIEYKNCSNINEEVDYVVNKIREIREQKLVDWDDFAILIRANSQAEPFIAGLELAGIPYEFLACSGLFREPISLDCLNFLKAVSDYHESSAVFRLLSLPFLELKDDDLHQIIYFAKKRGLSIFESIKRISELQISEEGKKIAEKIFNLVKIGSDLAKTEPVSVVVRSFLQDSGYLEYLIKGEKEGNRKIIRQIYYLNQFLEYIRDYEERNKDKTVFGWIRYYNYLLEAGEEGKIKPENTPDSVNILTVHSAKGLEFKYVFIVNLVEEKFPTRRRGEGIEIPLALVKEKLPEGDSHIQEERRLFYVAMTRAKQGLFLTSADDYGGTKKRKISRFLSELGFEKKEQLTINKEQDRLNGFILKEKSKDAEETNFKYEQSKSFSYSQINSYQKCPYQYKLAYILKIPVKGNAHLSFGTSIHNTLQKFYSRIKDLNSVKQTGLFESASVAESGNKIKAPAFDELIKIYENSWISDWYESKRQKEEYFEKGKELLKIFYNSQKDNWTVPQTLESWFKVKMGEHFITGRMDRLDKMADGTLEIIDYKTGKGRDKLSEEDKAQLLIYQFAAQNLAEYRNLGPVGKLTFYYLEDNLKTSFLGDEPDLQKHQEKLLQIIKQITEGDFTPAPKEFICKRCDFKDICEYRQL